MKFFGICLSLITVVLMYIQLIDQKSEIFVRLMLYQSKIPIPIWLLSVGGLVIFFLFYRNSNEKIEAKQNSKTQDVKRIENYSNRSEPLENSEKIMRKHPKT